MTRTTKAAGSDGEDVSVEEIVDRIRRSLRVKGAGAIGEQEDSAADAAGSTAQSYGARTHASQPDFDADLYQNLHQANLLAGSGLGVSYELGWRTPLVGHVWMAVRRRIHQEIRVYLDAALSRQSSYNSYLVRAFTRLMEGFVAMRLGARLAKVDAHDLTIEDLQKEIAELRGRVATLESELRASSDGGRG
jgi:hypothetical protein